MVELENIGEGLFGDFDPEDPEDENLLRFTFYKKDKDLEWVQIDDASYCTQLTESEKNQFDLYKIEEFLMNQVFDSLIIGSHKKLCEYLSWLSWDDFRKEDIYRKN